MLQVARNLHSLSIILKNLISENSVSPAWKNPILAAQQHHSQALLWNTLHKNLQSQKRNRYTVAIIKL